MMKKVLVVLTFVLLLLVAGLLVYVNAQQTLTTEQQLYLERKARIEMQMQSLQQEWTKNADEAKKHGFTIDDKTGAWTITTPKVPETKPATPKK